MLGCASLTSLSVHFDEFCRPDQPISAGGRSVSGVADAESVSTAEPSAEPSLLRLGFPALDRVRIAVASTACLHLGGFLRIRAFSGAAPLQPAGLLRNFDPHASGRNPDSRGNSMVHYAARSLPCVHTDLRDHHRARVGLHPAPTHSPADRSYHQETEE